MIITGIHISSFGKLRDFSLEFNRSLHIIEGENESGKSTVAAFIRYMLYGFDREDRISYERGISRLTSVAEGTMTIECRGSQYSIYRRTAKEGSDKRPVWKESATITDLSTGEITEGESAGERFLGIPHSIYRRIACIGQLNEPQVADSGMRESIENLLFSGDEKINIKHAIGVLNRRRESLRSVDGKSGEIPRLMEKRAELSKSYSDAVALNHTIVATSIKYDNTRSELKAEQQKLRELSDIESCYRDTQLVVAFDKLHQTKRRTNEISENIVTLREENCYNNFIPDSEYLTEISVNKRLYTEAASAHDAANRELDSIEHAKVVTSEVQSNLHYIMNHGGEDAVFADAKKLHGRSVKVCLFALGLAFLAVVIACAGVFAYFAFSGIEQMKNTGLITLLVSGAAFILAVAADVMLWINHHAKVTAEKAFYMDFGAASYRELMLRVRHIDEYKKQAAGHIMSLRAAHKYCRTTKDALDQARTNLRSTLGKWGRNLPDTDTTAAYADEVEAAVASYISTIGSLTAEKARLDATASQLSEQLKHHSEDKVRTRVPEGSVERMKNIRPEEIAATIRAHKERCELLSDAEKMLDEKLTHLGSFYASPAKLAEALRDVEMDLSEANKAYEALSYAITNFNGAGDRLKARITPRLSAHALELISAVTAGKYDDLEMSDDLSLKLKERGEGYSTELLSAGTRDIAYTALRIAMIAMVCREEMPPLCLDESFAYQDDTRAQGIMKMLRAQSEKGLQNIIFTCRPREEIIAHQIFGNGIGYTNMEAAV